MSSLKNTVIRVFKYQLVQGLVVVFLVLILIRDMNALISALFGLLLAIIPTLIYAKFGISKKIDDTNTMYRKHKKALVLKFLSNALGFLFVFLLYKNINVFTLFLTYIITLSGYWTSLLGLMKTK